MSTSRPRPDGRRADAGAFLARLRQGESVGLRVVGAAAGVLAGLLWFFAVGSLAHRLPFTIGSLALLVVVDVGVVLAISRALGLVSAMPVGVAGVVAVDWLLLPPTHATVVPEASSAVALAAYLLTGVLLGLLADSVRRRAAEAERGRRLLADEQAALRRVATLVAREAGPDAVFAAVAAEVRQLLTVDVGALVRHHPDGSDTLVAWAGPGGSQLRTGTARTNDAVVGQILRSDRPTRLPVSGTESALLSDQLGEGGLLTVVGCPVAVMGSRWGVLLVGARGKAVMPGEAESQLAEFTELVALAVANIQARIELRASRARLVAGADDARRTLERDLHDGVQQRLVSLALEVRVTETATDPEELRAGLRAIRVELVELVDELRELSHGLHPAILSSGGLRPALAALTRRAGLPTRLDYRGDTVPPAPVSVAAYYVVAESLTNIAKHADAGEAVVDVEVGEHQLVLEVADDGAGGADITAGTGLLGLVDRVEALGGRLQLDSRPGAGTTLTVRLPYHSDDEALTDAPITARRVTAAVAGTSG